MRGKGFRFPGWLSVLALVPFALSACSAPSASPAGQAPAAQATSAPAAAQAQSSNTDKVQLRFTWWGSQDRHNRTIKAIELFQQMHPNISITYEFANFQDYFTKMATYATGGNLPDLMQQDYATIGRDSMPVVRYWAMFSCWLGIAPASWRRMSIFR